MTAVKMVFVSYFVGKQIWGGAAASCSPAPPCLCLEDRGKKRGRRREAKRIGPERFGRMETDPHRFKQYRVESF